MASIILSQSASIVGGYMAGPMGAAIGYGLGGFFGSQIDNALFAGKDTYSHGARLENLGVQSSTYGRVIPVVYGTMRLAGNIIWARPLQEHNIYEETGNKNGPSNIHTDYSYSATFAIAICAGPIDGILRVWADNIQLDAGLGNYRLYKGDEIQAPDPLIESFEGIGKVPAYRGVAYVVIEQLPLAQFGNRIPNFTFEIKQTHLANLL